MNERILELIKQANIEMTYDPTETPMRAFVECWEDELGQFAELIVQECARVAAKNQAEDMDWDISEIIKEHFGVEK